MLEKVAERFNEKCGSWDARVWRKGDKNRIYFKAQKSATAYLDYEAEPSADCGAAALENASLKVFSNCESQGTKWNLNEAKKIKHLLMRDLNSVFEANFDICDDWRDVLL